MRKQITLALFIMLILLALPPGLRGDESGNRAALVVRFGDGNVATECVSFSEAEITGYELLTRSSLPIEAEFQGIGAAVCKIDQTGCPASDCFCQCQGSDCIYWSYWHPGSAGWQYSQVGAVSYTVTDGTIDGWSWGPGAANLAVPPPDLSFADVCDPVAADTPTPTLTPSVTPTPIVVSTSAVVTAVSTQPPQATQTATPTPVPPTVTPSPQPQSSATITTQPAAATTILATAVSTGSGQAVSTQQSIPTATAFVETAVPSRAAASPTFLFTPAFADKSNAVATATQPVVEPVVEIVQVRGEVQVGETAVASANIIPPIGTTAQPPTPAPARPVKQPIGTNTGSYALFGLMLAGLSFLYLKVRLTK